MNKMAIFVEGYTEVAFVDKLVQEIANENSVRIEWRKIRGGSTCRRTSRLIKAAGLDAGQEYFVLIFDCGNDALVKTRMLQEYPNLARENYQRIVCLRDVRPDFAFAEIPRLEVGLLYGVSTRPIRVDFILSIMEIEAWFLAETYHFAKIDPSITLEAIRANLQFDPENDDMQLRTNPANDLHNCYQIAGKFYEKRTSSDTVEALDFENIYELIRYKFNYLNKLIETIVEFLRPKTCYGR